MNATITLEVTRLNPLSSPCPKVQPLPNPLQPLVLLLTILPSSSLLSSHPPPPDFPLNRAALFALSSHHVNGLLIAYDPTWANQADSLRNRREEFARFIGLQV